MDTEPIGEIPKGSEQSKKLPESFPGPSPESLVVVNNEASVNEEARKEQLRVFLEQAKRERKNTNPKTISHNPSVSIPERQPSLVQRLQNVLKDTRLQNFAKMIGGSIGIMAATATVSAISGISAIDHLTMPLAYGFIIYEGWKFMFNSGVRLGEYSSLHREVQFKNIDTPIGRIHRGETIGTIHLMRSIGKMSDLSVRERAVVLPLDGLRGLLSLLDKFKSDSKDIAGITAIKASSHLVAQNRELFTELGFTLQEQSRNEKEGRVNNVVGKLITPFWGIRQLLRGNGLRGFREANTIRLGETQAAWITPGGLTSVKTRDAIQKQIDRINPVAQKVLARKV